jgi:hypothetical protein
MFDVILGSLENSILCQVFIDWMTRRERDIETDDDYIG